MTAAPLRPPGHEALLAAARVEFAERGYGSASIRDIAHRAAVSLSALYHYYGGKQELLYALLDEGMDVYDQACDDALAGVGDDPAERLAALVEALVRFRSGPRGSSQLELTEGRSLNPEQHAALRARQATATDRFREVIADGVTQGLFRTPEPDDARRMIIAACNAIAQWYRPEGRTPLPELIDRYVGLALTVVEYRPRVPTRNRAVSSR
ncbi:TetR/AcrR family transcriptional regulator [Cryptosporangium aurantiacum]|uniref:Transcriptional regulator, TetR family n=1 Tax=Cryptosporangium aurantiacum TaxID=134849 RepID=A0A1M7JQP4_9ACTN|nr:TetR/AcrR family transcriptional regulator [Cryptosporangium aurantiacum]SHM55308.1 transcriptional regulator, TetR family [Cryptosporangium aurantiacum]